MGWRPQPGTTICLRLCIAAHDIYDVPIVERMSEAIDGRSSVACLAHLPVILPLLREIPYLRFIHRNAAEAHGTVLAEYRDTALQVPWISEHRDAHRS